MTRGGAGVMRGGAEVTRGGAEVVSEGARLVSACCECSGTGVRLGDLGVCPGLRRGMVGGRGSFRLRGLRWGLYLVGGVGVVRFGRSW